MKMRAGVVALAAAAPLVVMAAPDRPDPTVVAVELFEGRTTAADAAQAWARAKVEPDEALRLVRELPLDPAAPVTSHRATLRDGRGLETDAEVVLPREGPGEDGRYRAMVLLHGIGGDARQPLPVIPVLVPPHTIVIAPSAKMPPAEEAPEDLRRSRAVGMDVMSRFPHWWSYRERGFPLVALDYLRRRYPIDPDRTVLLGYSMGGFGAWNVGLRFHDLFAGVAPLAGGISREEMAAALLGKDELTRQLLDNATMVPVFFAHGDQDDVVPVQPDRWSHEELTARRVPHEYVEIPGGKHLLDTFLLPGAGSARFKEWVETRLRRASPRRVEHRALGEYHGGAYWLRIDGVVAGGSAKVTAETQRNRVVVTTEGVSKLTLFLDPEVVDARRAVQVIVDDRLAFEGRVRSSLQAVAESFARARDPKLVYERMLTIDVTPRAAPGGRR